MSFTEKLDQLLFALDPQKSVKLQEKIKEERLAMENDKLHASFILYGNAIRDALQTTGLRPSFREKLIKGHLSGLVTDIKLHPSYSSFLGFELNETQVVLENGQIDDKTKMSPSDLTRFMTLKEIASIVQP